MHPADPPPAVTLAPEPVSEPAAPRRRLTLFDGVCIIVGIIIGAGFYETTPQIARDVGSPGLLLGVWLAGGLVSLVGAMCYAELATAWPREGGEYVFLTRAFGRHVGFLFAWAGFWVIRPGNVGAMAFVFASYAQQVLPLPMTPHHALLTWAAWAVVVFTGVNVLGVQTGKWTQNVLTAAKVLGLLLVFTAGLLLVTRSEGAGPSGAPAAAGLRDLSMAMILVLFTYGGWNEIAYVAAEVRNPERNLLRALLLGTAGVTAIYLLGNVVFLRVLGWEGFVNSKAVAADLLRPIGGWWGAAGISLLVCLSSLGSLSGMIFTGSRIFYAAGADHRRYALLGRWSRTLDAPAVALGMQAVITLALVAAFGRHPNGFERLVVFTAPLFWLFFLLTALSLFVLRHREPGVPRPYRVTLYPVTPVLFALSCGFMLYASTRYAYENRQSAGLWAAGVMVVGVAASVFQGRRRSDPRTAAV